MFLKSDKKNKSNEDNRSDKNISLSDVENTLVLKTWHASFFVLPAAKELILFFSNNRILTPCQITFVALIFRLLAAFLFLCGNSYLSMAAGGILYYMAYLFDCVDGSVARLTGQTSEFGRYFDHVSDLAGDLLVLFALACSCNMLLTYLVAAMALLHIAESYISYLAGFAFKAAKPIAYAYNSRQCLSGSIQQHTQVQTQALEQTQTQIQVQADVQADDARWHMMETGDIRQRTNTGILSLFNRYRRWWFDKNYKSFFSFPDYTFFVFTVMPIFGMPEKGLKIGFFLLSVIVLYTVFSTFISLHTDEKRFP